VAKPAELVVIGASAGGVEALTSLVKRLPGDMPAALAVVLHIAPGGPSVLPDILDRAGPLSVVAAHDGARLEEGRVYVAIPDHHLVIEDGAIRLERGPRENGHRPAVDPLFRTAAEAYGDRVTAVVLSGARDDGTLGALAVRAAGGRVLAQDPGEALYPGMPASVIKHVGADAVARLTSLADLIAEGRRPFPEAPAVNAGNGGATGPSIEGHRHTPGEPDASGFSCPECGGALYADRARGIERFTCHVGHAYSAQSLVDEHTRGLESALWSAIRRLDERAALLRRLAAGVSPETSSTFHDQLEARATEAAEHADAIRGLVTSRTVEAV
jgi:two-component system, chemotaxis family, protein-glutamate methylesterase/glutaminase